MAPLLEVRRVRVSTLQPEQRDRLWELYADHYDNVERAVFDRDLSEKDCVFLGTDAHSGEIVGFSTAIFYMHRYRDRDVGIYFGGDTIFQPDYWGQRAFHRAVAKALVAWKLRHPTTPLYWYIICSGYRTYLIFTKNFPIHWPHHERTTPEWETGLIDSVSRERYGNAWKPERGIISFDGPQPVLKEHVAPITPELLEQPALSFFVRVNPRYNDGDELAMLAPVSFAGLGAIVLKWVRRVFATQTPDPERAR